MTITQHANIYSFRTSNFNFGEIFFLIFYQYSPYQKIWQMFFLFHIQRWQCQKSSALSAAHQLVLSLISAP